MLDYLRHLRCYLYTGTTPASYTLGLIEAMMAGVPVVSIGPKAWAGPDLLFEGHEIATFQAPTPEMADSLLRGLVHSIHDPASDFTSRMAIKWFGIDTIGPQWREFLG